MDWDDPPDLLRPVFDAKASSAHPLLLQLNRSRGSKCCGHDRYPSTLRRYVASLRGMVARFKLVGYLDLLLNAEALCGFIAGHVCSKEVNKRQVQACGLSGLVTLYLLDFIAAHLARLGRPSRQHFACHVEVLSDLGDFVKSAAFTEKRAVLSQRPFGWSDSLDSLNVVERILPFLLPE